MKLTIEILSVAGSFLHWLPIPEWEILIQYVKIWPHNNIDWPFQKTSKTA